MSKMESCVWVCFCVDVQMELGSHAHVQTSLTDTQSTEQTLKAHTKHKAHDTKPEQSDR